MKPYAKKDLFTCICNFYFFFIQITPYKASEATSVRGYSSLLVATAEAEATTRTGLQHTHAHAHTTGFLEQDVHQKMCLVLFLVVREYLGLQFRYKVRRITLGVLTLHNWLL